MKSYETETENHYFDTIVEMNFTYELNPPRVEEGHGYHTFSEDQEIDREILTVKIKLSNEHTIDITDRLTEEERNLILKIV